MRIDEDLRNLLLRLHTHHDPAVALQRKLGNLQGKPDWFQKGNVHTDTQIRKIDNISIYYI